MKVLESLGWTKVPDDEQSALPIFCWCTRSGADFPAYGPADAQLPLIRPFPQAFTDLLDQKDQLAQNLLAAGLEDVSPPTWTAAQFLAEGPRDEPGHEQLWFLKHSGGVKGQAVFPYAGTKELVTRVESLLQRGNGTFVVQKGIAPPALTEAGRKFVLRVHVVLHGASDGGLAAYMHRSLILQEHARPYSLDTSQKSAHVSSAAQPNLLPPPQLLQDESLALKVQALLARSFGAVWERAPRAPYAPRGAELCQVFGCDVGTDASGRPWLIEVNSYPAIASGTMDKVDPQVYTSLVRDVALLVVLPSIEAAAGRPRAPVDGGFVRLDVEQRVE